MILLSAFFKYLVVDSTVCAFSQ